LPVEAKDAQRWLKIEDEVGSAIDSQVGRSNSGVGKTPQAVNSKGGKVEATLKRSFEKPKEFIKFFADNLAAAIRQGKRAQPTPRH